jgi:hypothetical protein
MAQWLKFIIIPFLTALVLEFISAVILGGFLQAEMGGWLHGLSSFIIHFIVGVGIYQLAPDNKTVWAILYALIYSGFGIYSSLDQAGSSSMLMGDQVRHQFYIIPTLANLCGLAVGIFSAKGAEMEDAA